MKRPADFTTRILFVGTLLLVLGPVALHLHAQAEFAIGSIIKKFELPQRDKEGKLRLTIIGREATVISHNRIKVDGLQIEIMRDSKAETIMTSPSSDYWREEERLTTESGIEVRHPSFTLTAEAMHWDLAESRGDFTGNVRLNIKPTVDQP